MVKIKTIDEGKSPLVPDFEGIIKNNPSGYILRSELQEATGGLLNGRTMANLDCQGDGISERIEFGRKRAYPVQAVIKYLQERIIVKYRDPEGNQ